MFDLKIHVMHSSMIKHFTVGMLAHIYIMTKDFGLFQRCNVDIRNWRDSLVAPSIQSSVTIATGSVVPCYLPIGMSKTTNHVNNSKKINFFTKQSHLCDPKSFEDPADMLHIEATNSVSTAKWHLNEAFCLDDVEKGIYHSAGKTCCKLHRPSVSSEFNGPKSVSHLADSRPRTMGPTMLFNTHSVPIPHCLPPFFKSIDTSTSYVNSKTYVSKQNLEMACGNIDNQTGRYDLQMKSKCSRCQYHTPHCNSLSISSTPDLLVTSIINRQKEMLKNKTYHNSENCYLQYTDNISTPAVASTEAMEETFPVHDEQRIEHTFNNNVKITGMLSTFG